MKSILLLGVLLAAGAAQAETLSGKALVQALQKGGYVIVMRHTSSPREAPTRQTANPENVGLERQLDAQGRATATAFGQALRTLNIPVGEVFSSPTFRALETVKYGHLPMVTMTSQLGDGGQSMKESTEAQTEWLKKKATELPKGTNTILVTHFPNMSRAFPDSTSGLEDGEALIFGPEGVVARVKIEDWPKLAK